MTAATAPRARAEAGQVTRAARGTALNLAGAVIGAVVSFVTVGVITNAYGKAGAGVFFAATAAFTLASNAARLGAESGLTYFVSRFRADDRHAAVPSLVRHALLATATAAIALGLLGLVTGSAVSGVLTSEGEARDTATTMIRILAVAVPTYALSQAMFGASRGFATMRPAVVTGQILRPLSQLVLVVAVLVVSDSVWPLAVAWAASSALTMVSIGGWLARRLARVTQRHAGSQRAGVPRAEYWRYTGPRALSDLLSSALERLDVLLVAILVGEVGAGMYGASNRLILAGQLMMIATAQSMAPLLSANFLEGRHDEAQKVLRTISGWNVTLLWPVFICLAFGAETALSVFGSEFSDAASLVVVLSLAFLVITGLGVGDTLLMMTGDSLASLVNHAIALGVMIGVSVTLLPAVGIIGAAWAWALSRIVLRLLAVGRVWQRKRVHAIGPPVVTAVVVATLAYVPIGLVARALLGSGFAAIALNVGLGAAIQLGLVLRYRDRLELDQLVGVIRRRSPRSDAQLNQS